MPNGGSILREYDANHNLTRLQDLNGGVTTYAYDENGNLTAETAPDGGVTAMPMTTRAAWWKKPTRWAA